MEILMRKLLEECETDVDGAIARFFGSDETYVALLDEFISDKTMNQLTHAVDNKNWDDAFMAAHALKGLVGNMGFVPLFHSLGELILIIRAKRISEITGTYLSVRNYYYQIVTAIKTAKK